ncbi:zf-HC2 domain-containing protein [Bacillus sp. FJAT-49732]|uniref:Zf-HC2 domain-containing protein n=1 Tax=Lederbergia citrisecunda TaxID=2833583 RepID=A0A942TKC8_9BACI|nr:zf-HC2 domain-containing protein [Lederbergia citrisecunda]MBS4198252.1 zf-HC2 domain-containing protein [Lederbergia citrisecunda]
MKNECYIVRDLLPSYIDELCSEESARFVEQHIDTCEECSQLLHQMRVEFDTQEQPEISARLEQKKPFQKIAHFFNAQKNFTRFFSISFWVALIITIGFFIHALNVLSNLNDIREEAQVVEQQKQDIMDKAFAILSSKEIVDETALQAVYREYSEQLQHLAVFSTKNIDDVTRLQNGPTTTFPIDYSQAVLVIGENGKISESIVPDIYDIGTIAMANNQWVVQYEYKKSYLKTVENAHQIKHYAPTNWTIFQLPIVFAIITVFILGACLFQKRITKPVESILD